MNHYKHVCCKRRKDAPKVGRHVVTSPLLILDMKELHGVSLFLK